MSEQPKRGAQPGNKNATKPTGERADTFLQIRVKSFEKGLWVKAARGRPLADWVIDLLNKEAARTVPEIYDTPEGQRWATTVLVGNVGPNKAKKTK